MSATFESTRIQAQTAAVASQLSAIEWITDSRVERLSQDFYWFSPVLKRQLDHLRATPWRVREPRTRSAQ